MKLKRFITLCVLFCVLLGTFSVFGCDGEKPDDGNGDNGGDTNVTPPTGPADYTLTLTDYYGNAPTYAVVVRLMQGDKQIDMDRVKDGKVTFKDIERGDYTFKVDAANIYYNTDDCKVTAEKTEAAVKLYSTSERDYAIYPPFLGDQEDNKEHERYDAAVIGEGATYVEIDRTDRAYCIFSPTRGGIYKVSVISDKNIDIGYYGNPFVVQNRKLLETVDNYFEIEIKNSSIGGADSGAIVIGLSSADAENAVITVERTGEPNKDIPFTHISATQIPSDLKKNDYINHRLQSVSVIDPTVKLVIGADGYYHYGAENGPIVYVRLASQCEGVSLASFVEMCEKDDLSRYHYDENGKLYRIDCYNQLIADYAEVCDENGLCPLTPELEKMIKDVGTQNKWWVFGGNGFNIFELGEGAVSNVTEANIVKGNEWMFALCYVEEYYYGVEAPIYITPSDTKTVSVMLKADEAVKFEAVKAGALVIENAEGLTVIFGGQSYTADSDGRIEISLDESDGFEFKCAEQKAYEFKLKTAEQ